MAFMDNSRKRIGANTLFRTLSVSLFLVSFIVALSSARSVPAFSADYSDTPSMVDQQDPRRLESITRDLEDLKLKLETAVEQIESGQNELEEISRKLKVIEGRLDRLSDVPGYRAVENQLRNLRRTLMESSLRRALAFVPSGRESFDPDIIREMFPDIEEMTRTSTRRDIFRIGKDVEIGTFEKVRGDVIVIGGEITVRGSVTGNVVAIGDDIHITSTGKINGDAVTVGGQIIQDAGGTVQGSFIDTYGFWPTRLFWRGDRVAWFFFSLAGVVFLLTVAVLVGVVVPKNIDRIEHHARTRFGMSFLIGLLTQILLPVICILLMITVIGIPVALVLIPLAVITLLFLGFTGVAKAVGQGIEERGLSLGNSSLALIAVGVLAVELVSILGRAIGIVGDLFTPLAFAIRLAGGLIIYVAWTTGLGAALMTRFGTRNPGEAVDTAPKPAPTPTGAEISTGMPHSDRIDP